MTTPDVSVVITTHNRIAFLTEAVKSVLQQHETSFELVIVDDASHDDTGAYLESLAADPRISIIRNAVCRERSFSRNAGLKTSAGRSVMFLDDDDVLLPGALGTLFGALAANPEAAASCGARIDWRPGVHTESRRRDSHVWFRTTRSILPELVFGWSAVSGQNLYRMDAARKTPGFRVDVTPAEDRLFWMEVARQGSVVLVPDAVMLYRLHDNQHRPTDMGRLRNRVFHLGLHMAHGVERRKLIRTRASAKNWELAESALRQCRFWTALSRIASAAWLCPVPTLASPLIFPWIFRRLARGVRQGLQEWVRRRLGGRTSRMDVAR